MKNSQGLEILLRDYQLRPHQIKKKGNVYQIETGDYLFALKEVKRPVKMDLFRLLQWLTTRGYVHHLPLIPDRSGNYIKWFNGKLYYLMPWIQEKNVTEEEKKKQMFAELARLHLRTIQTVPVTEETIQIHYDTIQTRWQQEEAFLLEYLERCERKWYLSPFEWRYVFYYHEIKSAYQFALNGLEKWREEMLATKRTRTCCIHGQMNPDHYLIDDRNFGYLINFEKSQIASPISDLLPYFTRSFRTYPEPEGDEFLLLQIYEQIFQLTEAEKLLLQSYLAYPGTIVQIVNDYEKRRVQNHEWEFVKKIETFYWSFKNRERFIEQMMTAAEEKMEE